MFSLVVIRQLRGYVNGSRDINVSVSLESRELNFFQKGVIPESVNKI